MRLLEAFIAFAMAVFIGLGLYFLINDIPKKP